MKDHQAHLLPATRGRTAPATAWWVSTVISVIGCCLLVSLGAQVRIPLPGTDVPMTLQSLAVLVTGFALSPARSVAAMLLYLACGTLGFPVFAFGSTGLLGPTGGYLAGFVAAAWVVAVLRGPTEGGFVRLLIAGVCGMAVLFAMGVGWRVVWSGGDVRLAVATGLVPFVPKGAVQVLLASTLFVVVRDRHRGRLEGGHCE